MIRIAIKEAAFAAIAASLPKGRSAHAERPTGGKVFLWLEDAIVNQLAVPRRPGEGHWNTKRACLYAPSIWASYWRNCFCEGTARVAVGSFVGLLLSQTYGGVFPDECRITPSRRIITAWKTGV